MSTKQTTPSRVEDATTRAAARLTLAIDSASNQADMWLRMTLDEDDPTIVGHFVANRIIERVLKQARDKVEQADYAMLVSAALAEIDENREACSVNPADDYRDDRDQT